MMPTAVQCLSIWLLLGSGSASFSLHTDQLPPSYPVQVCAASCTRSLLLFHNARELKDLSSSGYACQLFTFLIYIHWIQTWSKPPRCSLCGSNPSATSLAVAVPLPTQEPHRLNCRNNDKIPASISLFAINDKRQSSGQRAATADIPNAPRWR
jgi:hypothetical protein